MKHKKKPRIVIADPSLVDEKGHHYSLTMQISQGAIRQGIEVIWLTHKTFIAPKSLSNIQIYSIFSSTMYDRYRPEIKDNLPPDLHKILLDEIYEGIKLAKLNNEDQIYFHTGYGDLFLALPDLIKNANWEEMPYLHICTPYDLETMPGKDPGSALLEAFSTFKSYNIIDKKVFFWAETPQLAIHFTILYGFNVRAMPLPPPADIDHYSQHQNDENDTFTIVYLGAAREEKGFLFLPEIADALFEKYGRTNKLRFIIQCTPQIIGYLPPIKKAIDRLSKYNDSYVKLIDNILDDKEYHITLQQADVVLLLYSKKTYRIRGSGIAVEAVCADKCILTHRDTFSASVITHGGGATVENTREAIDRLAELINNKAEFRKKAKLQGKLYREQNSVEHYVEKIFNQTKPYQSVNFFPSSIVGHISPSLLKF